MLGAAAEIVAVVGTVVAGTVAVAVEDVLRSRGNCLLLQEQSCYSTDNSFIYLSKIYDCRRITKVQFSIKRTALFFYLQFQ